MSIAKLVRPERDEAIVDSLREALEMAKRGKIQEFIIVASLNDEDGSGYLRMSEFRGRWRMLGALEYAKQGFVG